MFHDWWWFVYTMSISLSFFVRVRDGGMGPHFLLGNGDERACYYCFVLFPYVYVRVVIWARIIGHLYFAMSRDFYV